MTREENCTYLLIKSTLAKNNLTNKLPKTMMTVRWVQQLKTLLTVRYTGCLIDVYEKLDNNWHGTLLCGETLNKAVKFMLIREILAHSLMIRINPTHLPHPSKTECMCDSLWVLRHFLPSRFKNQELTD